MDTPLTRAALAIDALYGTRTEAAEALGISISQLGNLLNGNSNIGLKTASRLYDVGINPDWIFGREGFMLLRPKESRFYTPFAEMLGAEYTQQNEKERLVSFLKKTLEIAEGTTQALRDMVKEQGSTIKELQATVLELRAIALRVETPQTGTQQAETRRVVTHRAKTNHG